MKENIMTLTLISHALCPYVQRAVIALQEKKVAFERIDIDLKNKPAWFLKLSPLGKTPVLKVSDTPVFESAVICEYLEDTTGPALHPQDALERARHRSWIEFSSALLNGIWSLYTAKDNSAYEAAAASLADRFRQVEQTLEARGNTGPYFAGERFSLVDAAFAPVFRYFDVFDGVSGIDLFASLPKTQAWRTALSGRASVQTSVRPDYPVLLRDFVVAQNGMLGKRMAALRETAALS
jgi:glutathione S-transferase